ncbi:hypothetical protein PSCICO_04020 [Pseudomonas cichorii]|nr:hypothetical protein PSCICO_04020 [Pseudomonas cichorii]
MAERKPRSPDHIALGTADIRQDGIAKIKGSQQRKQLFHRQNRNCKLNDISATTSGSQIILATIHNPQLNGQLA